MDHMDFWITSGIIIEENRDKIIQSSGKGGMKSGKASLTSQDKMKKRVKQYVRHARQVLYHSHEKSPLK